MKFECMDNGSKQVRCGEEGMLKKAVSGFRVRRKCVCCAYPIYSHDWARAHGAVN